MTDKEAFENSYQTFVKHIEEQLEQLTADRPDESGIGQTLADLSDKYGQDVKVIKAWISRGRDTGLPIDWERLPIKQDGRIIRVDFLRFVTFDRQRAKTYYEHGHKVIKGIARRQKNTANGALDRMPLPDTDAKDNRAYYKENRAFYETQKNKANQILDVVDPGRQRELEEQDAQPASLPNQLAQR